MVVKWIGAKYARKKSNTLRDSNTGDVYDLNGRWIGNEATGLNVSGKDKPFPVKNVGLKKKKGERHSKIKTNKNMFI